MSADRRWSVQLEMHTEAPSGKYENSVQELRIFLTDEQAHLVRAAILATLSSNTATFAIGRQGEP